MAAATNSIPAPTRRLSRAAGACRVLISAEVIALTADQLLTEISRKIERQQLATRRSRLRLQAPVRRPSPPKTQARIRS